MKNIKKKKNNFILFFKSERDAYLYISETEEGNFFFIPFTYFQCNNMCVVYVYV